MAVRARSFDFTNVREGSGVTMTHMTPGDYGAKVIDIQESEVAAEGENQGKPQWNFIVQLADRRSATYPYRVTLVENQGWKLRNLLVAAGKKVPKAQVKVNPNNLLGAKIAISLDDDEYEGRLRSQIVAVFPLSELASEGMEEFAGDDDEDEEEEEEAPVRKRAAKKTTRKRTPEPEPEDDEDEEEEEDEPPKRRAAAKKSTSRTRRPAKKAAVVDDEDEDEDEIDIDEI